MSAAPILSGIEKRCGACRIHGRDVARPGTTARKAAGQAFIPADRAATRPVPALSITENLMLRGVGRPPFSRCGWLRRGAAVAHASQAIRAYAIRASSPSISAGGRSGGNPQKIVRAGEIGRRPRVLVALQPTWALDAGATRSVLDRMLRLRGMRAAILCISSDLEAVMALGDRIGIVPRGRPASSGSA